MAWLYLFFGGKLEVCFTTFIRYADGFKSLPWTAACIACIALSMYFLELAIRNTQIGTAYAIWTSIGALGTVATGMIWFDEPSGLL